MTVTGQGDNPRSTSFFSKCYINPFNLGPTKNTHQPKKNMAFCCANFYFGRIILTHGLNHPPEPTTEWLQNGNPSARRSEVSAPSPGLSLEEAPSEGMDLWFQVSRLGCFFPTKIKSQKKNEGP